MILSQKVCAGRIRTNAPTPGYNIQSLFRILPQHTVALRCAKSLELPQNGFLRGNQTIRSTCRPQGNRILSREVLEQVVIVPSGLLPLGLDADLCGCFLFEHVHRHMPDDRQVLVRIPSPDPCSGPHRRPCPRPNAGCSRSPITVQTFDRPAHMCYSLPYANHRRSLCALRVLCGWTIPVPVGDVRALPVLDTGAHPPAPWVSSKCPAGVQQVSSKCPINVQ